jgi:hypothetical protein
MITGKGWMKVYCFLGRTEGETWGRTCRAVDVRTVETTLGKAIISPIDGTDKGLARRGPTFYPMAPLTVLILKLKGCKEGCIIR